MQESFQEIICPGEEEIYEEAAPVTLTDELIEKVLTEQGIQGEPARHIKEGVAREFEMEPPALQNLIDEKALEKNARKKEEAQLRLQVQSLQKELAEKTDPDSFDVMLRVNPEKTPYIKSEIIDGQKCLIIPIEENEQVNLNGVATEL